MCACVFRVLLWLGRSGGGEASFYPVEAQILDVPVEVWLAPYGLPPLWWLRFSVRELGPRPAVVFRAAVDGGGR